MRLVGLDFETANTRSGSICAAGIAVIQDGMVMEKREWLVRPHSALDWMVPTLTKIHGINFFDLRRSPEFPEIWPVMKKLIRAGDCVAIHAPSDLRHLSAVLGLYHLSAFSFDYVCWLEICQSLYPKTRPDSLNETAKRFDFEFQHRDALENAIACAVIVSRIGIAQKFIKRFESSIRPE